MVQLHTRLLWVQLQIELQYRGRLDNLTIAKEGGAELFNAMELVAATGNGPENQIASIGCSIKWK